MFQTSLHIFFLSSAALVASTLLVFVSFLLMFLSDRFEKGNKYPYWKNVVGTTLVYLSGASILWGIANVIALIFAVVGTVFLFIGNPQ